jgi:hypothetical protein
MRENKKTVRVGEVNVTYVNRINVGAVPDIINKSPRETKDHLIVIKVLEGNIDRGIAGCISITHLTESRNTTPLCT